MFFYGFCEEMFDGCPPRGQRLGLSLCPSMSSGERNKELWLRGVEMVSMSFWYLVFIICLFFFFNVFSLVLIS